MRRSAHPASIVVFALCVSLAVPAQAQDGRWSRIPEAPDAAISGTTRHDDIFFVDTDKGALVNLSGEIWMTSDGGQSWVRTHLDAVRYRSVTFKDETIGWAGTINSIPRVLFETRDGGDRWDNITSRISGTVPAGICGLQAVNATMAVGVGAFFGSPTFIKTTDGGSNWAGKDLSTVAETLVDVHFFDESEGILVGGTAPALEGTARILRTTDGGDTWNIAYTSNLTEGVEGEWAWKISFPTRMVGYVSIEYNSGFRPAIPPAKVLKTVDGGVTWTELTIPGSTEGNGLQGIGFVTENVGWASGRGTTSLTTDGGETWTQLEDESETHPDGQLDDRTNRIFRMTDSLAYAVGQHVYKFEGTILPTSVEPRDGPGRARPFSLAQNYPNPFGDLTTIGYRLEEATPVRIYVIDQLGRTVRTLVDAVQPPGDFRVEWDGRDAAGRAVASGTYLYIIDAGVDLELKSMVVIR